MTDLWRLLRQTPLRFSPDRRARRAAATMPVPHPSPYRPMSEDVAAIDSPPPRRLRRWLKRASALLLVAWIAMGAYQVYKPLPPGISQAGPLRSATDVALLTDIT